MIIDAHTHLFQPECMHDRGKYLADTQFRILYAESRAALPSVEEYLEAMSQSGVDRSVALSFPWDKSGFSDEQNEFLIKAALGSGGRIVPFGSIALETPPDKVRGRARELRERGFAGIGEIAFYRDGLNPAASALLRALFEASEEFSLPLSIHLNEPVGHAYPGKYDPAFAGFYSILKSFPAAKVILDHWGGGLFLYELMPEVAKECANVFYDTAASPYIYDDRIYKTALGITGPRKILFGSDYPLISPQRYISSIEKAVDDADARAAILGGNAAALLCLR